MIEYAVGDVLALNLADVDAITISVSADGVIGDTDNQTSLWQAWVVGKILDENDKRSPMVRVYGPAVKHVTARCKAGEIAPGTCAGYSIVGLPLIIFACTRASCDGPALIEDVGRCVQSVIDHCKEQGANSVAMPLIGTGHGALAAALVGRTIRGAFDGEVGVNLRLHLPPALMSKMMSH